MSKPKSKSVDVIGSYLNKRIFQRHQNIKISPIAEKVGRALSKLKEAKSD